jgi:hypothetical protein
MGPYRAVAYRGPRLITIHHGPHPKTLGQTFDQMLGLPACSGDICRLVFHTGATVLGVHVGLKEKGLISVIGWIVAVGQGFAGILDLVSLYKRATGTHPPE